ncbi:MAG: lysozyme [Pseudomonadota bacterium]
MPTSKRKNLFDTVRAMLGRGFRQSEVDAMDAALDQMEGYGGSVSVQDRVTGGPSLPAGIIKRRRAKRRIGAEGTALIKRFEGCARLRKDGMVEAYPDPGTGAEPWTIGWGATGAGLELGSRIGPGTVWTQEQCDARLADDLKRYARDVAQALGDAPATQSQFDAMVSFHYNTGAIGRATLTKRHVAGDYEGAAREFARWNKAGGRVLRGLVRRRSAEEALYRKG